MRGYCAGWLIQLLLLNKVNSAAWWKGCTAIKGGIWCCLGTVVPSGEDGWALEWWGVCCGTLDFGRRWSHPECHLCHCSYSQGAATALNISIWKPCCPLAASLQPQSWPGSSQDHFHPKSCNMGWSLPWEVDVLVNFPEASVLEIEDSENPGWKDIFDYLIKPKGCFFFNYSSPISCKCWILNMFWIQLMLTEEWWTHMDFGWKRGQWRQGYITALLKVFD